MWVARENSLLNRTVTRRCASCRITFSVCTAVRAASVTCTQHGCAVCEQLRHSEKGPRADGVDCAGNSTVAVHAAASTTQLRKQGRGAVISTARAAEEAWAGSRMPA